MKYGVLLLACLLLASCATMKNADAHPEQGPCVDTYHNAQYGEKEALAGIILIPGGLVLIGVGIPMMAVGSFGDDSLSGGGVGMIVAGSAATIAGILTLIEGHYRVNKWNDSCVGGTAAEQYCLFNEPFIEKKQ